MPFSEAGLQCHLHRSDGVLANVACLTSFNQALPRGSRGWHLRQHLQRACARRSNYRAADHRGDAGRHRPRADRSPQLLIGSIRRLVDVNEALQDGAHVVAVPPPIPTAKMLWNPRTESTIRSSTCLEAAKRLSAAPPGRAGSSGLAAGGDSVARTAPGFANRLIDWLRADRSTLPPANPRVERVARLVVVVAGVWFALAAGWEIAGPFASGPYAAATAVATGSENM